MKRCAMLMVLVLVGSTVADVESPDPTPFPELSFSLLDLGSIVIPNPADTAWLHLESRHHMGPSLDLPAAPVPVRPAPPESSLSSDPQDCVCYRCPELYWDKNCPVCGRFVEGTYGPASIWDRPVITFFDDPLF